MNKERSLRPHVMYALSTLGWLALAWWCLTTTGCAGVDPGVDFTLESPELRDAASAAAAEWCDAAEGRCCPTFDGGANTLRLVSEAPRPGCLGWTAVAPGRPTLIRIVDSDDSNKIYRTIRHELGHACSAAANPDHPLSGHLPPGNVMAARDEQQSAEITPADVAFATEARR
jgi:hypothetical protein